MIRPIFYDFLKFMTWLTHLVHFRRYRNHYNHPLPKDASIIFAANHQNSFMDAIALIAAQSGRPTWLTRANMFKTAIARFWLHALYMIPIYRTRDGLREVSKNQEIIKECIRLLNEEKQPIGIFPEGNHNLKYSLRPLQKGIARIAFDAAEQSDDVDKLYIVPCGFTYSDHTHFRTNLLVIMGEPIPVKPYYEQWKESTGKATRDLLNTVRVKLSEVMIHIEPENYEETFRTWQRNKPYHPNLQKEFLLDKEMIRQIESGEFKEEPIKKSKFMNSLYAVLGFPLFLLGWLNNLPVWAVSTYLVKKVVTDEHFVAPIRCYSGLVIVPLFYLIQGLLINLVLPVWWWSLVYLLVIFILGQFAGDYYYRFFTTPRAEQKIPGPVA